MNDKIKERLLFPETLFSPDKISFSSFLYFNENPIYLTLQPTISIFQTGCDPFKFFELTKNKNPKWLTGFGRIFNTWFESNKSLYRTEQLLKPIQEKCFKTIWLSYPRTEQVLKENNEIIKLSNLDESELLKIIDFPMASQEVIAHILFEKFVEIYETQIPKGLYELNHFKDEKSYQETRVTNIDYIELFEYCNELFRNNSIENILINSYFFRANLVPFHPNILLNNEKLIDFFSSLLPKEEVSEPKQMSQYEKLDVIGWEIFRQLTSKYIDSKKPEDKVQLISNLIDNNKELINRLKNKCYKLAEDFSGETDSKRLSDNIAKHIKIHVEEEIKELLKLKKFQFEDLFDEVFSDEKTWLSISTFIFSLAIGGPIITAGAGLAAFANLSAKSYKIAAQMEKKIKNSDYALIYRMTGKK